MRRRVVAAAVDDAPARVRRRRRRRREAARVEARRVEGRDPEPRGPRADERPPLRRQAADERDVRVAAHDGPALADGAEVAVRAGDVVRRRPHLGRGRHGAGAGLERPDEPPRLRLPLPDDDVLGRAVAEAHADGDAGLVGRLQPLAQAPRLDDAAPPGRALACGDAVASMASSLGLGARRDAREDALDGVAPRRQEPRDNASKLKSGRRKGPSSASVPADRAPARRSAARAPVCV